MGLGAGQIVLDVDLDQIERSSSDKPICRLIASAAQSIPDTTVTAITFASESIDTHGFFSSGVSTTRITPNVAGYYRARGTVYMAASNTFVNINCYIRKNGSTIVPPAGRAGGMLYSSNTNSGASGTVLNLAAQTASVSTDLFVDMNGTTDYLELCIQMDTSQNVALNTNQSSQFSCVVELGYERALA